MHKFAHTFCKIGPAGYLFERQYKHQYQTSFIMVKVSYYCESQKNLSLHKFAHTFCKLGHFINISNFCCTAMKNSSFENRVSKFHRDSTRACTLCFFLIWRCKKTADPNDTKNSLLLCDFLIFNYEYYCKNLFIVKNTTFDKEKNSFFALCQNQEWHP